MARGKKGTKTPKDPWSDLDKDYQELIQNKTDAEIRQAVAETNLELQQLLNAKEKDLDLKEKGQAYQEAGRTYREATKGAKLRTKYALYILEARGKA